MDIVLREKNTDIQNNSENKNNDKKDFSITDIYKYLMRLEKNELKEEDFYPPEDKRSFKSGVSDIKNGDTFKDFFEDYMSLCEKEDMFEE